MLSAQMKLLASFEMVWSRERAESKPGAETKSGSLLVPRALGEVNLTPIRVDPDPCGAWQLASPKLRWPKP